MTCGDPDGLEQTVGHQYHVDIRMDCSTDSRTPVLCEDPDGLEHREMDTSVVWGSGWIGAQTERYKCCVMTQMDWSTDRRISVLCGDPDGLEHRQ